MELSLVSTKDFLTKHTFSYCMYAFILLGIYPLVQWTKHFANFWVNENIACESLDPFFIWYSLLFEGWCIGFVILFFAFVSKREMLVFITAGILCLLITMLCKDILFGNVPRPTKLFPLSAYKHILSDISVYKEQYSFPSGHSMFSFTIMALLAMFSKKKWIGIVCFIIALGAAFSRIYLLQHFFIDIYVGSILGFLIALGSQLLFTKVFPISDSPLIKVKLK